MMSFGVGAFGRGGEGVVWVIYDAQYVGFKPTIKVAS